MYHIFSRISRSAYKSTHSLDVRKVQNLTPAYKSMLGWELRLWAAGGDVHLGRMALAEHPAACRQRRDAAAATRDDTVEAGKWVVHGR